ncbi:MAG: alpha/beta fold hydrolase [Victivallales bacterium]|nr:alpha/beta fold hydrolase [Victivallales bacterium]
MRKDAWKNLYPYDPNWMTTSQGHRIHYVNFGRGTPVVLLHGHLTWTFYYRDLIPLLATTGHHAIAVDQLGYGLSDHPEKWSYRLQDHLQNFTQLMDDELKLPQFDLVMQGWGSTIGLNYAIAHPDKIRRIVLLSGTVFPSQLPNGYTLLRLPIIGKFLAQNQNFLTRSLTGEHAKHLPQVVKDGYLAPYEKRSDRAAMASFVEDLPFSEKHPTWQLYHNIEMQIGTLAKKPFLILWGEKDTIIPMDIFHHWQKLLPNALALSFPDAGHLLLEDEPTDVPPLITRFLLPDNKLKEVP